MGSFDIFWDGWLSDAEVVFITTKDLPPLFASKRLKKLGIEISEAVAIIELPDLDGSKIQGDAGLVVHTFCEFGGD